MNDRNNHNIYKEVMLKLYHLVQTDGENSRRLPTLRKLAEQFNCTHPTVLRAVRELVKRDVLVQLKTAITEPSRRGPAEIHAISP